jgi:hypothetical protein
MNDENGIKKFLTDYLNNMHEMYSKEGSMIWGWTSKKGQYLAKHYFKWVQEHGSYYERDVDLTNELLNKVYYTPRLKECYANSLHIMNEQNEIGYCEGWMISSNIPIPIEHAWNIKDGKVLDFTSTLWGRDDEERLYFGVQIPSNFVREECIKTGVTGPYLQSFAYEQLTGEPMNTERDYSAWDDDEEDDEDW